MFSFRRISFPGIAILVLAGVLDARAAEVSITDCGAVGDGHTLNTSAIQLAIDRCAGQRGGVVLIPRGTFLTGSIFLRENINLKIDEGGTLLGSQNTND